MIPNYRFFRRDRVRNGRNGGGVGIYVRTDLKPQKISLRSAPNLEFIAVELLMKKEKMSVASVYKPPQMDSVAFLADLTDILAELRAKHPKTFLLGDINIDSLAPEFDAVSRALTPLGFRQMIREPTHLRRCTCQRMVWTVLLPGSGLQSRRIMH